MVRLCEPHRSGSSLLSRFRRTESGQDLIEYALLAAFVGLAGAVALGTVAPAVQQAYSRWGTASDAPGLWEPAPPASYR